MMKRHWPILFAILVVIISTSLAIAASNSTDTGVVILVGVITYMFLFPAAGAVIGGWYGWRIRSPLKWLLAPGVCLAFFLYLAAEDLIYGTGSVEPGTYLSLASLTGMACLVVEVIASAVSRLAGKKKFHAEVTRVRQIYERFLERSSRDDEFSDWAEYRVELTAFIIENTEPGESLLILGAGKCNDLDLIKLAEHAGSIVLSDYREETVAEAFQRYGLEPSERIRFVASDYVGITDDDYIEYTDLLLSIMQKLADTPGDSLEEIAGPALGRMEQTLEQIYERNLSYRIDLGVDACDCAVIAGLHSQLNNAFRGLFQYVQKDVEDRGKKVRFAEDLNEFIFRITKKHIGHLVERFNDVVFDTATKGVVYAYEESIIYTPEGSHSPVIGTVDGARQAGEMIAGRTIGNSINCLWPLSRRRGIKFEMTICYLPEIR